MQTDLSLKAEINLYYDLYVPDGAREAPLMIAVHGYGAHKRQMMREAKLVAPENFVIASVQGPHQHFRRTADGYRIGFGWLTEHKPEEYIRLHHDFLLRVIDKLSKEGSIDPSQIYLYGFSQACALNFRFAFTHPEIPRVVIGLCGGIPGDLDTNPIYRPFDARTFYLYGDDDEFYSPEKFAGFEKKLRETLPNFTSRQYNAKHEISERMRSDVRDYLEASR
jgi:predicted esterase